MSYRIATHIDNFVKTLSLSAARAALGVASVDHTHVSDDITDATSDATANTVVKRGSVGQALFSTTAGNGPAVTGTSVGIAVPGISGISDISTAVNGVSDSGRGMYGESSSFIGGNFVSSSGTGVQAQSISGTGGTFSSSSGTYSAEFKNSAGGGTQSAVERVRGWFVWLYNGFIGRLKTADITAEREWTLPDATGTITLNEAAQTLTNKTLGSGTKVAIGSDGTGDVYYRAVGGELTRLAAGTNNHVLTLSAGLPSWSAVTSILGIPIYADLTAANDALASGQPYYDTALSKLQITTA